MRKCLRCGKEQEKALCEECFQKIRAVENVKRAAVEVFERSLEEEEEGEFEGPPLGPNDCLSCGHEMSEESRQKYGKHCLNCRLAYPESCEPLPSTHPDCGIVSFEEDHALGRVSYVAGCPRCEFDVQWGKWCWATSPRSLLEQLNKQLLGHGLMLLTRDSEVPGELWLKLSYADLVKEEDHEP